MTLERWLLIATAGLATESVEQVRTEITEHYLAALESEQNPETALDSLGDPKAANRQYRRALLTAREAYLLRGWRNDQNFGVPLALPVALLGIGLALLATALFLGTHGAVQKARVLLTVEWLPLTFVYYLRYTQPKLIQRCLYYSWWTAVVLRLAMQFAFGEPYWSYWSILPLIPFLWAEREAMSIRRKVPREDWPPGLYR
jgi:hypothetical protein